MARVVRESVKIAVSCEYISEHAVQVLYSRLRQRLGSERVSLEHVDTGDADALAIALQSADVLVTNQKNFSRNTKLILSAGTGSKLQWVQSASAGVEKFFITMKSLGLDKLPFTLTRCGGIYGPHMAEYVVGQIIARQRDFFRMQTDQLNTSWNKSYYRQYRLLSKLSIGILGVGEIGREVAKMCKAFGMTVWGITRHKESICPHVDHHRLMPDLPEVLASCDYVCNILPSTPETKGTLGGDKFRHCANKKSVFINIGRGDVASEKCIVHAIREGWLGGAILDVFETEPLPPESPFWTMPEVFISPHVSAVTMMEEFADLLVENVELFISGQPLKCTVETSRGY